MLEIVVPSLVGALLAISWYWVMDLLPPFRAARRTAAVVSQAAVPAPTPEAPPTAPAPVVPVPVEMPVAPPRVERAEAGAGIGQMVGYIVLAAEIAKREQARRIAVLQTGATRADVPALQAAVGASREVIVVSTEEALQTRFDVLLHVEDEAGKVPASILKVYDMNLKVEDLGRNVIAAVGTPTA